MRAHQTTATPFNQDGPDRVCDGPACPGRARFFLSTGRDRVTGLPIIGRRWCQDCVPADWIPARRAA